ncbi:unnamed protein product [Brassica oleracea var. botrytis]
MFQRWSTKKSRLPVAGLLFMLALAVTFMVLYDERSIHHDNTNREQDLQETSTLTSFVHPNLPSRNDLEVLDRFSRCNSTNEYSGKKMEWVDHSCSGQGSDFVAAKENICDVFSGKWVFDNSSSYPLHKESDCPYMSEQLACEKYGRPYLEYQHWRWQPHPPCNLKRWNVTEMWEMLMGKRMMFVGDSLNRGQWFVSYSLLSHVTSNPCLLTLTSPSSRLRITMPRLNFCGLHFSWNPNLMTRSIESWMNGLSDQIQFSNMQQCGNMLTS